MKTLPVTKDEVEDLIHTFKCRPAEGTCRIMVRSWSFLFEYQQDVGRWRELAVPFNAPRWAKEEAGRIMQRLKDMCA